MAEIRRQKDGAEMVDSVINKDNIVTFSNVWMNPSQPKPEDIKIEDIAHALSMMVRANGHFRSFYSVAQHSINCAKEAQARALPRHIKIACLLHDASEAYLSDITRPVKMQVPEYAEFERKMMKTIWQALGLSQLTQEERDIVKEIDSTLLYYEFLNLHGSKVFSKQPEILSVPDYSEKHFKTVKNNFLFTYKRLSTNYDTLKVIGIDGCSKGWICAVVSDYGIEVEKLDSISDIVSCHSDFDAALIDIPIGLQSNKEHIRPDSFARKFIKERSSTIFPAPCRQAVYAQSVSEAYNQNERVLGKKFTPLTVGIIPKIKEVDMFFQDNPEYKNKLNESHPEVCFAVLKGETVMSKKNTFEGMTERINILGRYNSDVYNIDIMGLSKEFKCAQDDIVDAVCLAITASLSAKEKVQTLPQNPEADETGLLMQMVIPKI